LFPLLIAPFFRASLTIGPSERPLFARSLPVADFHRRLQGGDEILRQNLRRLFAAARLAEATGGRLALVEGFRGNRITRRSGRERFVTGSWLLAVMLRALQRRGLVGAGRPLRTNVSRCTAEEAEGIAALAGGNTVIGVTSLPCPSARRAHRYLARVLPGASVVTPAQALARTAPLSPQQAAFWDATAPRGRERWLAPVVEAPNWGVHVLSEAARALFPGPSLERRLARALRPDRKH
jgi:hypothetical protein